MNDSRCRNRILWILLIIWAVLCAARAVDLAVFRRGELQNRARKIALRTGVLPVMRGKLTQDGKVLAWSEVEFVLLSTGAIPLEVSESLRNALPQRGAETLEFPIENLTAQESTCCQDNCLC